MKKYAFAEVLVYKLQIRKSQKRLGPQIANPQRATFAEGPQIYKLFMSSKFADLRFVELFYRPPTFAYNNQ